MKRILLVAVLLVLVAALAGLNTSYAQTYAQNAFNRNDKVISAGLGFGMYGLYGTSSLPPIFVAFETGVAEKITIGGIVAYSGSSEDFSYGSWKYTYIIISARGAYHFLEKEKSFDAYAGAGPEFVIVSSSVTYNNPAYQQYGGYSAGASYFFFDFFVGGRYYFTPKFAVMAELGYGVGFFRAGVSYKL